MSSCSDQNNFNETPDICWVIALKSEAIPIISQFKLSLLSNELLFPIYKNQKLRHALVISGIGQINAAAATAYLASQCNAEKWTAWLNVGIAGYSEGSIGEIFQAIKVTNLANSKSYFPGCRLTDIVPFSDLQTLDEPSVNYKHETLYDMEGAAFSEVASRISCNELAYVLKVVSDTPSSLYSHVEKIMAQKLVEKKLGTISIIVKKITELVDEEKKRLRLPLEVEKIFERNHFSATRKKQFIQKYRMLKAFFPQNAIRKSLGNAANAKDFIKEMDNALHSIPINRILK